MTYLDTAVELAKAAAIAGSISMLRLPSTATLSFLVLIYTLTQSLKGNPTSVYMRLIK